MIFQSLIPEYLAHTHYLCEQESHLAIREEIK